MTSSAVEIVARIPPSRGVESRQGCEAMPITWRMNGRWADVTFSDPYTLTEAESVMKEIYRQRGLPYPLRFLVDVRKAAPPSTEFVTNAIMFWQLHVDKMWGAKVAIVTGTERQARMAQVSESTAQSRELPFTLRVFDEPDTGQALQWLARDDDATPHQP
jgi:hypothetical protein